MTFSNENIRYIILNFRVLWGLIIGIYAILLTGGVIGSSPIASWGLKYLQWHGRTVVEKQDDTKLIPLKAYLFKTLWLLVFIWYRIHVFPRGGRMAFSLTGGHRICSAPMPFLHVILSK